MSSPEPRLSRRARWAGGQPISDLMHRALANPGLFSLAAGFVDPATLPVELVQEMAAVLMAETRAARAALQYGTTPGDVALREALLDRHLQADRSGASNRPSIDQVIVTAGSNQLLHLASDTLLDPGDIVLCESPTYFVYLGILKNLGARAVGVDVDERGMVPEALDEHLHRFAKAGELARVKAIYSVSYFDNPRGVTLAAERRPKLVEIARRWSRSHRIYILEDAAYRELRYDGADLPSVRSFDDAGDAVIFTQSFSKSLSPGLRIGYGILPRELVDPVLEQKGNLDFGTANFNQCLLARILQSGRFDTHVATLRTSYTAKRDTLLAACDEHLRPISGVTFDCPAGGLYVWLTLPEGLHAGLDEPLFDRAVREGMIYVPGEYCFPAEGSPVRRNTIRLSFGVESPENMREAVKALARAIRAGN